MNMKDFEAGKYLKQYQYKSFSPAYINHTWVWHDPKVNVLLEKAIQALGELNAFSFIVPDIDLFIRMHIIKEAQTSSRIEGTMTEMDEVVMDQNDIAPEKRNDWQEVQNYIKAMNHGVERLREFPLSSRLLCEMHAILMDGARGEHKSPGEFRRSQNWIGGSGLNDAMYIPPSHVEVSNLMNDFENFLHNEDIDVPHLIKAAIAHYQFETIHPFCDGNGRIGRLLITFYFVGNGLLAKPSLYLSDFFEKNRNSYYDALSRVRESNDVLHWVKFFLNAVVTTANKGKDTFQRIIQLKQEMDRLIAQFGRRAENARKLIYRLYSGPVISISEAGEFLDLSPKAAGDLIKQMEDHNILREFTGYKRNRHYIFDRYLEIFHA
ncbi:Adenosine monophosphate-protein transferase SoFic [Anaerohalosphaera lusitana]|uniref:Adenosine monophosphate-protein transferase SoFic n=1 Tax=Anaerohalosphaera lusitana TaxID=1936003 RepID=A0A1U9NGL8_9BACT|nr:Fic family protein [Anaerohalosphaera lusitana]AQT67083.1 Adenosine monophosphate-protein transferase SoFic [Anaerohalosphaera lusitana]